MLALATLREVLSCLDEQVIDEQVVLDGVAEEDGRVDGGVVEGAGVRLVLQQGRAADVETIFALQGQGVIVK